MIESVFWLCVAGLVYTYVGYPILIGLRATQRPRSVKTDSSQPPVTVVVIAYNEASNIAARLENILDLDYPRDRLDVLLISDGSTDGTVEIARSLEPAGVTVLAFETRRGKA